MSMGKKLVIGFAGLVVVVFALRHYGILPGGQPYYTPIPPVVLEDGSVEYTLVTRKLHDPDQHWVLRFPKELLVTRAEDSGRSTKLTMDGVSHTFNFGVNRSLTFYLKLPSLSMEVERTSRFDDNVLEVYLYSFEEIYGTGAHVKIGAYTQYERSYLESMTTKLELECRKESEITPGVFLMRDLTETEIKLRAKSEKKLEKDGFEHRYFGGCFLGSKNARYAVYDKNGKPVGSGKCSQLGSCSFSFWLKQNRIASYKFDKAFLPMIQNIHGAVIEIVDNATDTKKSINLFAEGENK